MNKENTPELEYCWEQMKPAISDLTKLIALAPCPADKRYYLAFRAAGEFLAAAIHLMKVNDHRLQNVKNSVILDQVIALIRTQIDTPKPH